ncbi:MAG: hypothetical protein R3F62_16635 [Planctomycetota bacterium]
MDVLVALLRQPTGLEAVLSRAADDGGYREIRLPIEALPAPLAARVARLRAAHELLGRVLDLGPEVEAAARRVLAETVVDPDARGHAVLPEGFGRPRALPRRTAAHPRGYQGTKVRPPKPPGPPLVDLRPVLCSAGGLRELRGRWRKLPRVRPVEPAGFARSLGWTQRSASPEIRRRLLALYWALDLDADVGLRAEVASIAAVTSAQGAEAWLTLLAALEPGAPRLALLRALASSGALLFLAEGPDAAAREALAWIAEVSAEATRVARLRDALRALVDHGDLAWFRAGVALAERFDPACDFARRQVERVLPDLGDVEGAVVGFMERIREDEDLDDYARECFALDLWESCARLPGWVAALREPGWQELAPRTCYGVAEVLTRSARWGRPCGAIEPTALRELLTTLRAVEPGYLSKAVELVGEGVGRAPGAGPRLGQVAELIATLCRPPHGTRAASTPVAGLLAQRADLGSYLAAPAAVWNAVEQACARGNDARLIVAGAGTLADRAPDLARAGFVRAIGAYLRCARTLGALSAPDREAALRWIEPRLPTREALEALPLPELVAQVEALGRLGGQEPVRRRLRAHLRGEASLRATQLDSHRARLLAALPELALHAIRRTVVEREAASLGFAPRAAEDVRVRHALLLRGWVDDNRRGLNRVLRAVARGEEPQVQRHPLNAAWFAAHPKVLRRRWRLGIALNHRANGRTLRLGLERDPLEVLRLGTHVGSCVGLGGSYACMAAAIALDANKAVVYARAGETFVARQVLAISEDERLVAYEVYPEVSDEVVAAFRAYDETFAQALGLPLDRESRDPDVALLVAREGYRDYPLRWKA